MLLILIGRVADRRAVHRAHFVPSHLPLRVRALQTRCGLQRRTNHFRLYGVSAGQNPHRTRRARTGRQTVERTQSHGPKQGHGTTQI
jgi:hypothetical protein